MLYVKLTELKKNQTAKILLIGLDWNLKKRLLEMGFCFGAEIKFIYEFNTTFAYEIKNGLVALRKEDAEKIFISLWNDGNEKI